MTSVLRCGDDGCPCRNLPAEVDQVDVERLRAEVERLKADAVESRRGLLNWSTDLIDERDAAVRRASEAEAKIERVRALCVDYSSKVPSSHFAVGAFDMAEAVLAVLDTEATP